MEEIIKLPIFTLGIKQSAKGNFYADEIKVRGDNAMDVEGYLKEAVAIIQKQLHELNTK